MTKDSIILKLRLMLIIFVASLIFLSCITFYVIDIIKVNGTIYQKISSGDKMIADIKPPSGYIEGLHMYVLEQFHIRKRNSLESAEKQIKIFEDNYIKVLANWDKSSPKIVEKINESNKHAEEYFRILKEEFIPALYSNDLKKAENVLHNKLEKQFMLHKEKIEEIILLQEKKNRVEEKNAGNIVEYSTAALLIITFITLMTVVLLTTYLGNKIIYYNKELNRTLIEKERFYTILSHDLRGPIGNFHLIIKELNRRDDIDENEKNEIMAELEKGSEKTYNLLENLLEWGRLNSDKITPKIEKENIWSVINEGVAVLEEIAAKKQIKLKMNECDEEIEVEIDRYMMTTVIRNLISNAIKFTDKSGEIAVIVKKEYDKVVINIIDNGVGMDAEKLDKLFRKDEMITTYGTNGERGSGVGLKLCKEFVEMNNGRLSITSEMGKGTKIKIELNISK